MLHNLMVMIQEYLLLSDDNKQRGALNSLHLVGSTAQLQEDNKICIWLEDVWSERCYLCAGKVSQVCVETIVVVDTFGPARCRTHGLCVEATQVVDTQHQVRLASFLKWICVETTPVVEKEVRASVSRRCKIRMLLPLRLCEDCSKGQHGRVPKEQ